MTQGLEDVIGLGENELELAGPVKATGLRTLYVNRDVSLIYVYCELIELRSIGDTLAPLLRVLPMTDQTSDIIHYVIYS